MTTLNRKDSITAVHEDIKVKEEGLDSDVPLSEMHFAHMSGEERTTTLRLARELDPGPSLGSLRHITFVMSMFVVLICSCDSGFDSTIMS
jgi:hypothetical protein